MRDSLLQHFKQHSSLPDGDIKKLVGLFRSEKVLKGACWICQAEKCNDIAFLKSGILRVFYTNEDEEITLEFVFPNSFTTALGCGADNKSSWSFQAIDDCELLLIDKEIHRKIITTNIASYDFYEKQLISVYNKKERKLLSLLHLKAEERFENLFKEQPQIFNFVPLKFIASSLGITPETLSRLRKKLVR